MDNRETSQTEAPRKAFSFEHWPRYQNHGVVQAARIIQVDRNLGNDEVTAIWVDPTGSNGSLDPQPTELFKPTHLSMEREAQVGGWAIVYEDAFRSISPERKFLKDYDLYNPTSDEPDEERVKPISLESLVPVLMTRDNPSGWRLEVLLRAIRMELGQKNEALTASATASRSPGMKSIARGLITSNGQIIALLARAEEKQRIALAQLDMLGPDQGPGGPARL